MTSASLSSYLLLDYHRNPTRTLPFGTWCTLSLPGTSRRRKKTPIRCACERILHPQGLWAKGGSGRCRQHNTPRYCGKSPPTDNKFVGAHLLGGGPERYLRGSGELSGALALAALAFLCPSTSLPPFVIPR